MNGFVYVTRDHRGFGIREKRMGGSLLLTLPRPGCIPLVEYYRQKQVERRAAGRPIFCEMPVGALSAYQPHKKLYYRELETVLRKAGRRLHTDFSKSDLGLVCGTLEEAKQLLPRLCAPVIWVFCRESGQLPETEEDSPVFYCRDEDNISRLPGVIALQQTTALSCLSPKTVLFNLTKRDFVREYTVNDAWVRFPPEYAGIDKKMLNSILYDLDQADKVSSLRWG